MTLRRLYSIALFSAVFLLASHDAEAQQKVGDVITNVKNSWVNVTNIFSTIAWIAGSYLGVSALFKFKDHVDNPMQVKISEGVKRMIAGGMFLSLPFTLRATAGNLFGGAALGANKVTNTGFTVVGLPAGGLDDMVVKMISNIGGPMEDMLTAFSYLAGIALLLSAIFRLTKRMEEGPRGPAGFGTIMTFIAAGALFSFGDSIGAFTSTLFGDNKLLTKASISAAVIANAADAAKVQKIMEGVMVFVMLVGYISFIRGWFVLKNFADGQQGATLAQGLTFLFGGALAINLGELVNALQATVGVNGITFG